MGEELRSWDIMSCKGRMVSVEQDRVCLAGLFFPLVKCHCYP